MRDMRVVSPHEHRDLVHRNAVEIARFHDIIRSLFLDVDDLLVLRSNASWLEERTADLKVKLQAFLFPSDVSNVANALESNLSVLWLVPSPAALDAGTHSSSFSFVAHRVHCVDVLCDHAT